MAGDTLVACITRTSAALLLIMNVGSRSIHAFHDKKYSSVKWVSIVSDNGLSPVRRQAITCTNADLLSIESLGTNFNEILIKTQNFSFTKMHLGMLTAKWQPFCPGGRWVKSADMFSYTVVTPYDKINDDIILHILWQWQIQHIEQIMYLQKIQHIYRWHGQAVECLL